MADNVAITAGSGTTIAADEVTDGTLGSVKVQFVKLMDGTLDGTTKAAVGANGLKVDPSGVTAPISATALPLPTGAATAAAQTAVQGTFGSITGNKTVIYDGSGAALDYTAASPTYPLPATPVSGAITTAMTGTTSTSLLAAPGSSLHNYITTIVVSNSHATVGTDVIIQDGNAGATLMTIPAAAVYGGAVINLPTPLKQPTANAALYCANATTGASTKVSAVGFSAA